MRVCQRCVRPKGDGSFYPRTQTRHPFDICKPCIHRPNRSVSFGPEVKRTQVKRMQTAFATLLKQEQANGQPLVYLAKADRNLKIGFSNNVTSRLKQLSTGSAAPIQLIAVVPGGRQLEQELHAEFSGLRTHGEWFRDTGNVIVKRFASLPRAMVFLPEYLSQSPLLGVTE
jgi:hypothetical protein